jgi:hypothetical protein
MSCSNCRTQFVKSFVPCFDSIIDNWQSNGSQMAVKWHQMASNGIKRHLIHTQIFTCRSLSIDEVEVEETPIVQRDNNQLTSNG